jgi:hypothetical protein
MNLSNPLAAGSSSFVNEFVPASKLPHITTFLKQRILLKKTSLVQS